MNKFLLKTPLRFRNCFQLVGDDDYTDDLPRHRGFCGWTFCECVSVAVVATAISGLVALSFEFIVLGVLILLSIPVGLFLALAWKTLERRGYFGSVYRNLSTSTPELRTSQVTYGDLLKRHEEPPSADQSLSEPPSADQSLSEPPSADQSLSEPPSADQSLSEPPSAEQSISEPPSANQSLSEPPSADQSLSEPPSANQSLSEPPISEPLCEEVKAKVD